MFLGMPKRKCLRCGKTFYPGDIVCSIIRKCPHCGSYLTIDKIW